jgi:hypothetical protein
MSQTNYAQRAGILCNDPMFCLWLDRRKNAKFQRTPDGTHTADDARDFILKVCKIQSRKELDSNQGAAKEFFRIIHHFNKWKERTTVR